MHQPTNALNNLQFMTYINRLHVLAPGCHPPGVFQIKGIQAQHASLGMHRPTRHTSHFARFIWTRSLRTTKVHTYLMFIGPCIIVIVEE